MLSACTPRAYAEPSLSSKWCLRLATTHVYKDMLPTDIELHNEGIIRLINFGKMVVVERGKRVQKEGGDEWKDLFTLTYNIYFLLFHHRSTP